MEPDEVDVLRNREFDREKDISPKINHRRLRWILCCGLAAALSLKIHSPDMPQCWLPHPAKMIHDAIERLLIFSEAFGLY